MLQAPFAAAAVAGAAAVAAAAAAFAAGMRVMLFTPFYTAWQIN